MKSKQGHITAVGLGPGDPLLVTMKGYNALANADFIFYPASSITENEITSFALPILEQLDLETEKQPLLFEMNPNTRKQCYQKAFKQIKQKYDEGLNIAVVSEGDILFYSTFGYLWKYMQEAKMNCTLIPGIPAFIAAGSLGAIPLTEGNSDLKVIARPKNFEEINQEIEKHSTVVVMKLTQLKEFDEFIEELEKPFLYAEKVGTEEQFFTSNAQEVIGRPIPYFSLLIIYS